MKTRIARQIYWCIGIAYILCMLYFTLRAGTSNTDLLPHFDKMLHAAAHFVLCCWFIPLLDRQHRYIVAIFSVFLGIAIEGLQTFVPNRQADLWDLLANFSGTLFALKVMSGNFRALARSYIPVKTKCNQ